MQYCVSCSISSDEPVIRKPTSRTHYNCDFVNIPVNSKIQKPFNYSYILTRTQIQPAHKNSVHMSEGYKQSNNTHKKY